jgi:hypothetical protein
MASFSTYSSHEVHILMSLRLLLWPTAFRAAIRSHGTVPGGCGTCGATAQTATHLLNVPSDSRHTLALRSVPQARHTAAVSCLVTALVKSTWRVIVAEGHSRPPDRFLDTHTAAITAAKGRALLDSGDGAQHYKPDAILLHPSDNSIYIVDVHFGSDDKLEWEDALLCHLKATYPSTAAPTTYASPLAYLSPADAQAAIRRGNHSYLAHLTTVDFTTDGQLSSAHPLQASVAQIGDADVRKGILSVSQFSLARYARRYAPLVNVLRRSGLRRGTQRPVHLLVLSIGVTGTMPAFTTRNTSTLFSKKMDAKKVRLDLRHCAWRGAVSAYKAWRHEE